MPKSGAHEIEVFEDISRKRYPPGVVKGIWDGRQETVRYVLEEGKLPPRNHRGLIAAAVLGVAAGVGVYAGVNPELVSKLGGQAAQTVEYAAAAVVGIPAFIAWVNTARHRRQSQSRLVRNILNRSQNKSEQERQQREAEDRERLADDLYRSARKGYGSTMGPEIRSKIGLIQNLIRGHTPEDVFLLNYLQDARIIVASEGSGRYQDRIGFGERILKVSEEQAAKDIEDAIATAKLDPRFRRL